jgi:hypothetical protein
MKSIDDAILFTKNKNASNDDYLLIMFVSGKDVLLNNVPNE